MCYFFFHSNGFPMLIDRISMELSQVEISKWASTRENLSSEVCEQQRHRPACASAQSD